VPALRGVVAANEEMGGCNSVKLEFGAGGETFNASSVRARDRNLDGQKEEKEEE